VGRKLTVADGFLSRLRPLWEVAAGHGFTHLAS
jgi:hypothetical protein